MSRLRIAPIVEGRGESEAIRILLQRTWMELLGGEYVDVLQPIRGSRPKLVQASELARAVDLAVSKLRNGASSDPGMVLILLDADEDPPCQLGPSLLTMARAHRSDTDISCVIVKSEYETWFIAAAQSLSGYLDLSDVVLPEDPESAGVGKAWIQRRFKKNKDRSYRETVDQPAMTRAMDLAQCRLRSPSFDKLCRDLQRRLEKKRTG